MEEKITLTDRKSLNIIGATKVVSSTATQAVVEVKDSTLIITGKELAVVKLNLASKEVEFSGIVTNLKYTLPHEKIPLFKRIFK